MASPNVLNHPGVRRIMIAGASAAVLAWSLSGCGKDTVGKDDGYKVRGEVVSVGKSSVALDITEVISAHGRAKKWFRNDESNKKPQQLHHNIEICNLINFGDGSKTETVTHGKVADAKGAPIKLTDLSQGDQLIANGHIQDTTVCWTGYSPRATFDLAKVVGHLAFP